MQYRNEYVHRFNPKDKDPAYPCPRTHEKVSKLLYLIDNSNGRKYSEVRHSIEGAIEGIKWNEISKERKFELIAFFNNNRLQ